MRALLGALTYIGPASLRLKRRAIVRARLSSAGSSGACSRSLDVIGFRGRSESADSWRSFLKPLNLTVPTDCQRCGVCCFSPSAEYVWVTGYDWTLLGQDAERLAHFIGNRAFMKMSSGHCSALEIRPSAGGETGFSCSIYERRPEICRALGRGSPECLGELETKAAEVAVITTDELTRTGLLTANLR